MRIKSGILFILFSVMSISCNDNERLNFDRMLIPLSPVNLEELNSHYDDFNSAGPQFDVEQSFRLIFSSNRNSNGGDFDLICYRCNMAEFLDDGSFNIWTWPEQVDLLDTINSPYNELGPSMTFQETDYYSYLPDPENDDMRFFFTSDRNGSNDIFYINYTVTGFDYIPSGEPAGLDAINTASDEGYLTINPGEIVNRETVYFTSDRDGGYDIYRAMGLENLTIESSATLEIEKVEILSSEADDKCPYIMEDLMVFTSDMPGGFGGFDLWYSLFDGTTWGTPVNFGETINISYNEYRPVVVLTDNERFLNDMIIFSSDRPGGKGRYDLYLVGLSCLFN